MKRGVIGAVSGLVIGVAIGASVIAPRLNGVEDMPTRSEDTLKLGSGIELLAPLSPNIRIEPLRAPVRPAPSRGDASVAEASPTPPPKTSAPKFGPTPIRLRMESAFFPAETHATQQGQRITELIRNIGGGEVEIEYFGPGQFVAPSDLLNAVSSGALDAAFAAPSFWSDHQPSLNLFGALPFGPAPDELLAWFFGGGGKKIYDDAYGAEGLKGLICGLAPAPSSGWFQTTVTTPEDFQNLRIHAHGPAARIFTRLGADVYNLDTETAIEALKNKSLDGAIVSAPSVDLELGASTSHYYFPGWHQPTRLLDLIINKDRWDVLSPQAQALIETACNDNLRHGLATADIGQFAALMKIAEKGVEVHRWPESVMTALRRAWADERTEMAARDQAFGRGWASLNRFREDQAIWRELARP